MGRIINVECPPAPPVAETKAFARLLNKTFAVDVCTPMFGGGAVAGEIDSITAIRASGIRGQLRAAWRATRGLDFQTVQDLRSREAFIWGAANTPSKVIVEVNIRDKGREVDAETLRTQDSNIAYAIFPFVSQKGKEFRPARKGREGVKFDLIVRYPPELKPEITPTLWYFFHFGNVGARGRRGLGAVVCPEFTPRLPDGEGKWFYAVRQAFKLAGGDRPWPVLGDPPLISQPCKTAREAWSKAVGLMREFRQGYGTGRNRGPGRSFWPEADSLRMITGRGEAHHMESLTVDEEAFPRVQLGAPIVMHFKGGADSANDCMLTPLNGEMETKRMASPIILRPLAVEGGKYVAMVLRLRSRKPSGVRIKSASIQFSGGPDIIERPDLASYPTSPLNGTKGSAVDAFMAFAKRKI